MVRDIPWDRAEAFRFTRGKNLSEWKGRQSLKLNLSARRRHRESLERIPLRSFLLPWVSRVTPTLSHCISNFIPPSSRPNSFTCFGTQQDILYFERLRSCNIHIFLCREIRICFSKIFLLKPKLFLSTLF